MRPGIALPPCAAVVCLVLAGCAGPDWSRNLYEGIRQHRQARVDPATPQAAVQPDYEQYRREREMLRGPQPR